MNNTILKLYDNIIENACISSALLSQMALNYLMDQCKQEDFYFEKTRILFLTLRELFSEKQGIDLLVVKDRLIKNNLFIKITDVGLLEIYRSQSTSANIQYYIDRLLEYSKQRKLQNLTFEITDKLKDKKNVNEIVQELNSKLKDIDRERGKVIYPVEAIIGKGIQNLAIKENEYVKTGIRQLDDLLFGLFNSELIIIAARPGLGKSSLALNLARNMANKIKVLFFSLEMATRFLSFRLLSAETGIDSNLIMHGIVDKWQMDKISNVIEKLKKINLHINDQGNLTVENIINMTIRSAEYEKPGIAFVDYAGIVKPTDKKIPRHEQIGHIAWSLRQNLAKELDIPVVLLAQLNRTSEERAKGIPRLSDLKESGNLEEHSDKVIFIYEEIERSGDCELIVAKNRNGAAGHVKISFERKYTRFV